MSLEALNNNDIRRISNQLDAFYTAFRSNIYYSEIHNSVIIQQCDNEFWKFQKYLLLYSLIVNWCEVFGPNAKNNHWKEITLENRNFTKLLYEASNFDYAGWSSYRKYVNDVKNSYITEPDEYHHDDVKLDLYGIDVSLNVTHQWLNQMVEGSEDNLSSSVISRWPIDQRTFSRDCRQEFRALFGQDEQAMFAHAI